MAGPTDNGIKFLEDALEAKRTLDLASFNEDRSTIKDIVSDLKVLLMQRNGLEAALSVYADPDFYEDMTPSKALDDRGGIARSALNTLFPE